MPRVEYSHILNLLLETDSSFHFPLLCTTIAHRLRSNVMDGEPPYYEESTSPPDYVSRALPPVFRTPTLTINIKDTKLYIPGILPKRVYYRTSSNLNRNEVRDRISIRRCNPLNPYEKAKVREIKAVNETTFRILGSAPGTTGITTCERKRGLTGQFWEVKHKFTNP
jgi:hypothetical protein